MICRLIATGVRSAAFVLLLGSSAFAQWTTSISKDEMTGEHTCYAHSRAVSPVEKMGFPYGDTTAWLGVGCDGKTEWVYVGFNESPNLIDTTTEDGFERIQTRIKWDDTVETVTLTQEWGGEFIHFTNDKAAIDRIAQSNTVLLELNWYGEGRTYFRIPLSGSSAAISKMRSTCSEK
jgi:hypothetical protein